MPTGGIPSSNTTRPTSGRFILVVEDDDAIRESLLELLELEGHATLAAANGADAMRILHAGAPCLLLLDWMMPGMNGLEFLLAIGRLPEFRKVPVIVMSAQSVATNEFANVVAFVAKPLNVDHLLNLVSRHCPAVPRRHNQAV